MIIYKMKDKFGLISYYLRTPKGLVCYGGAKHAAIMGAGFGSKWATKVLTPSYSSLRQAKYSGMILLGSFLVKEKGYA